MTLKTRKHVQIGRLRIRSENRLPRKESAIEPVDFYKIVLETRNLELKLFWERCNYFLVLNSGLAIAYFQIESQRFLLPVAIFAVVVCIFWFEVALGSKFWALRWEQAVFELENGYVEDGSLAERNRLFSASSSVVTMKVKKGLQFWTHGIFARWIDSRLLKKPSVSLAMMKLIVAFIVAWAVLALLEVCRLIVGFTG